jgi:hypothetical protein
MRQLKISKLFTTLCVLLVCGTCMASWMSVRRRVAEAVAASNLVLEYLFGANGSESTITLDTSGNNYTGTVTSATWNTATNGLDNYYYFSAANTYITSQTGVTDGLSSGFTASCWVKRTRQASNIDEVPIMAMKVDGSQQQFRLQYENSGANFIDFYVYDSSGIANRLVRRTPSSYYFDEGWRHLVCTYDGTTNLMIYSDGVRVDDTSVNAGSFTNMGDYADNFIRWGAYATTLEMQGDMAFCKLYDTALTAAEILATNRFQAVQLGIASKASYDLGLTPVFDMTSNGNGATPQDGSTNAATVTATALAEYDLGVTNSATTYNGSTSSVQIDDTNTLDGASSFSLVGWIRSEARANFDSMAVSRGSADNLLLFTLSSAAGDDIECYFDGSGGVSYPQTSDNPIKLDIWQQVAATWTSGEGVVLWVDGIANTTGAVATGTVGQDSSFYLGEDPSFGRFWDGELDEWKFYDSQINPAQLYTNESTLFGNFPYYASIPEYDSLVWGASFNAGESKDWSNYGRNGNDGSDTAVTYNIATGDAEFNGSTSGSDVGSFSGFAVNNNTSMSWSAWVKPQSDGENNGGRIIANSSSIGGPGYFHIVNSEAAGAVDVTSRIYYNTVNAQASLSNPIPLNSYTHLAFVWNEDSANKIKIYTNGVLAALDTDTAGTGGVQNDSAQSLHIGDSTDSLRSFDGFIDDLLVWTNALTATQVTNLYDLGRPTQ